MPPNQLPQPLRGQLIEMMSDLSQFLDNPSRTYVLNAAGLADLTSELRFDLPPRLFCDQLVSLLEGKGLLDLAQRTHALTPLLDHLATEQAGCPDQLGVIRAAQAATAELVAELVAGQSAEDRAAPLGAAPLAAVPTSFAPPHITGDTDLLTTGDLALLQFFTDAKEIYIEKALTKGVSGAKVLRCDIQFHIGTACAIHTGRNIIKIDQADLIRGEAAKHAAARSALPGFVPEIIRQLYAPGNPFAGVVYAMAGEYARRIGPLADEPLGHLPVRLQHLSTDVLARWNAPDTLGRGHKKPHEWVLDSLNTGSTHQHRIDELRNFNPIRYAANASVWFVSGAGLPQPVPNPLFFATHPEVWPPTDIIIGPLGHVHGDLHGDNLMCRNDVPDLAPTLIDFARGADNASPFFDYAYLELDLLLRHLAEVGWADWRSVMEIAAQNVIPAPHIGKPSESLERWGAIAALRNGVDAIIKGGGREMDDFERCWWLTAAGVGLLFARRESYTGKKQRAMSLLYSAFMLRKALENAHDLPAADTARFDPSKLPYGPFAEILDLLTGDDLPTWLAVPGGAFSAGDPNPALGNPPHAVTLPDFLLARTPITHQQYARFVRETDHRAPGAEGWAFDDTYGWSWGSPPQDRLDHPVVYISADDAAAYCQWLESRIALNQHLPKYRVVLPSADEWERAGRGAENRAYPCNVPTTTYANYGGIYGGTTPVMKFAAVGAGPYGHLDLAGNVWEWTRTPHGPDRVVCGGCWDAAFSPDATTLQSAYRNTEAPSEQLHTLGFRPAIVPIKHLEFEPRED